jgi:hypothetical protein
VIKHSLPRVFAMPAQAPMKRATMGLDPGTQPPPMPDFMLSGYTGPASILETVAVLAVTGAAAWVGIRTGLGKTPNRTLKIAGWTAGVGSALLGILYLGGKSGIGTLIGLPAVRVTPS